MVSGGIYAGILSGMWGTGAHHQDAPFEPRYRRSVLPVHGCRMRTKLGVADVIQPPIEPIRAHDQPAGLEPYQLAQS